VIKCLHRRKNGKGKMKFSLFAISIYMIASANTYAAIDTSYIVNANPNFDLQVHRTNWGASLFLSLNKFYYDNKTTEWLPNHGGPCFDAAILYKSFNLIGEFRPWTINGKKDMVYGGDTLFTYLRFNDCKANILLSYNYYIIHRLSIEPFFGIGFIIISVIDEDKAKKTFNIPGTNGLIIGTDLNLAIRKTFSTEFPLRLGFRYSFVNLRNIHADLGNNYMSVDIGIGFRGRNVSHRWLKKDGTPILPIGD
jgi:hypothetical protein